MFNPRVSALTLLFYMAMCNDNKTNNKQDNIVTCNVAAIISTNNMHPTQYYDDVNQKLYLTPANFEDVAVFHTGMFLKIFKKRKYEMSGKIPIVKISYGNKSIYRRVELVSCKNSHLDVVGLTYKSMRELTNYTYEDFDNEKVVVTDVANEGKKVNIEPTGAMRYYFYHPNSATRMSFRIGIPSLIIGFISLLMSIISLF